jgi:hypothetical protein
MFVVYGSSRKSITDLNQSHTLTVYIQECFDVLRNLLGDVHLEYNLEYDTINVINFDNLITFDEATRIHEELNLHNLKIVQVYSNPKWYHIEITNNVFESQQSQQSPSLIEIVK